MAESRLTADDVNRLLTDPSGINRAHTAEKLARQFEGESLSPAERMMAEEIFRLFARDVEVQVRKALSSNLKETPLLPHDLACTLAGDVDEVALPILEYSTVLSDQDLLEIVRSHTDSKMEAIARRKEVSEELSEVLVQVGGESVVATLVANAGARVNDASLEKAVERFGSSERVAKPLIDRPRLPATVAEKLVDKVSENMRAALVSRHDLDPNLAANIILAGREKATLSYSIDSSEEEVERLVQQLAERKRLTPSIIVRALCMGDIKFFEYSLAQRSGIPVVNARMLIHDSGNLGFQGIYRRAGLPDKFFPAMLAAVTVAGETEYDGRENDRARYARRMIERILTQYGDLGVSFENDDLDYLLAKMDQLPSDIENLE
ncbi:DUF2336 domain-containing protein [Pararhodospirillum photometricum]|uniref:DUF2336 domain-containing protein n=1 Tax=Pararhodospirillum photometricum DSM 122 TaxID=1150469 RepID=H6SJB9_PARPM|nr:DUF2336 domain-containing protein [Pararhodospirillum photometricum]CCG08084.1 Putative uncharacterized protein [Pararhodospirillum photometricum DSM 122]